jgi:hypothetical protein
VWTIAPWNPNNQEARKREGQITNHKSPKEEEMNDRDPPARNPRKKEHQKGGGRNQEKKTPGCRAVLLLELPVLSCAVFLVALFYFLKFSSSV